MDKIVLQPIGRVLSIIQNTKRMPIVGQRAAIEIFPEYHAALHGIEDFSHLWVLSWFHLAHRDVLESVPLKINPDTPPVGVFALRSPARPNPIALSLVTLDRVGGRPAARQRSGCGKRNPGARYQTLQRKRQHLLTLG